MAQRHIVRFPYRRRKAVGIRRSSGIALVATGLLAGSCPLVAQGLPTNWQSAAIGNSYSGNAANYSNGVFTVVGPGDGMGGRSDSFQFAYTPLAGDGTVVARWTGVQQQNGSTRYGVMIRDGAAAGAASAFMAVAGSNNSLEYRYRLSTSAGMSAANGPTLLAPYWLKLVRAGSVFTAYSSADGTSWVQVGTPQTITMGTTAYAGLAVTSASPTTITSVTFDNVTVSNVPDFYLTSAPVNWTSSAAGETSS
jgi:hypothetical protein